MSLYANANGKSGTPCIVTLLRGFRVYGLALASVESVVTWVQMQPQANACACAGLVLSWVELNAAMTAPIGPLACSAWAVSGRLRSDVLGVQVLKIG
jgi:hypothetical protein